ncbi:LacI family DNA-binding transcriptional regulator [Singulisphaera sp. PoT]|uniref:LacI family DNA-binding transcriptional regulator n=1 Tax=Singulisphaera sp. PoT TaxID=3411797 RepID=UPI003BF5B46A
MTLREVAKRAGVSLQSVSNVLNGRTSQMREETRQRILESIRELNYQPNTQARGLRLQRTNTVAFLTIDPAARFLADPFHVAILSGLVDTLRGHDYSLFVQGIQPDQAVDSFERLVHRRRFDGAVVHLSGAPERRAEHIRQLEESRCPFVLIEERVSTNTSASVVADNRGGAAQAVAYLRGRGHSRIGFLATDRLWPAVEEREAGYAAAVVADGGSPARIWKVGRESIESAREAVEAILRAEPGMTALLCATDVLALGAVQAAKGLGREVPGEFAVIGFDNVEFASYVDPPLSTVAVPGYEMGSRAADLLLGYFKESRFEVPEVVFPTTLVIRGSA